MNKFKPGDRVKVYGMDKMLNPISVYASVSEIRGDIIFLDDKDGMKRGEYDLTMVHVKQCRKLKKRERLEGWVNVYKDNYHSQLFMTKATAMGEISKFNYLRTVKMREVKDE